MKRKKYDHKHQASGRSSHGKNEVVPEDETQSKDTERVVISQPKEETKELEPQDVVVQDLYDMPTESNGILLLLLLLLSFSLRCSYGGIGRTIISVTVFTSSITPTSPSHARRHIRLTSKSNPSSIINNNFCCRARWKAMHPQSISWVWYPAWRHYLCTGNFSLKKI